MDRREFVAAIATTPIALALPAGAVAQSGAVGETIEAATDIRAALAARLNDALRDATCLDLSGLDPSDRRHGWRERVRDAAQQLAVCR